MHKNTICAYFYIIFLKIGYSKYQKNHSVYNRMKGDGIIKVILKFLGTGYCNNYQANVKIFECNKEIVNTKTYNGEICLLLKKNKVYRLKAKIFNQLIETNFYTNDNRFIFNFNPNINRTIILSLKDYYYNIPIEKGEIILWQK